MAFTQFPAPQSIGSTSRILERNPRSKMISALGPSSPNVVCSCLRLQAIDKSKIHSANVFNHRHRSTNCMTLFSSPVKPCRKCVFHMVFNQYIPDCGMDPPNVEEEFTLKKGHVLSTLSELGGTSSSQSRSRSVKSELIILALPALAGQAIEPLAQLMETAYIGRLGPVELASAAVSTSIFNIISKLFNIPLLSVATSFVAEDISKDTGKEFSSDEGFQERGSNGKPFGELGERKQLPSVSTALLLAVAIGIFEALALYFGSGLFLNLMGITSVSSMRITAERFLSLRALGAPAVVVSLALQGVFRGFKDTKTPALCLGGGNFLAVFLFPILMYYCHLGVTGAAIATVTSQYVVTILMIWSLNKRAVLLPPKMENLHFGVYIKSGGFLLGRTLAVLVTMTLGTSMAVRQGPLAMAAHQICLQVWLAVSMLTDAVAASGQALIASSFSKRDYSTVKEITHFILKMGVFMGISLALILGASFGSLATLFTKDEEVLGIVRSGILFVSASQPFNALAFIFDGLHYGVSDFSYAAQSMIVVGAISSAVLLYAPSIFGLYGVWLGLTLFMSLRMMAGFIRLASKNGPWWFLQKDFKETEVGKYDRSSS